MIARTQLPDALVALMVHQDGVVTAAQALAHGIGRSTQTALVRQGRWHRISPGIFSDSEVRWLHQAWAGVLLAGPGSALGGEAALHLLTMAPEPEFIDVWTPLGRTDHRRSGPWRFHRGTRTSIGAPARTSVEEAILDVSAGNSADVQSHWLSVALSSRRTTPERLQRALQRAPRLAGRRQLAELLGIVSGGSHSPLEVRYFRDVERAHGLPKGRRQRSLSHGTRSDIVYDEYRTIIELDGQLGHRGRGERRDAWRDLDHLALGYATGRLGWPELVDLPCDAAASVSAVLQARGWDDSPFPCPRCRPSGRIIA